VGGGAEVEAEIVALLWMRGTVMKRHKRSSARQKLLQQRSEEGLDTKSGSFEVGPLQQRGVRDLDLSSSSVAVEPLQQHGMRSSRGLQQVGSRRHGPLHRAWRRQALPARRLPQVRCRRRTPHCKAYGGGRRCQQEGCTKSAVSGGTLHCKAHGGGGASKKAAPPQLKAARSAALRMAVAGGASRRAAPRRLLQAARCNSDELTVL
jgi:hypothetical protein